MKNTTQAVQDDVVRYVGQPVYDITVGKLYHIYKAERGGAYFYDDKGNGRAFWLHDKYEIVGKVSEFKELLGKVPEPVELLDIQGQSVRAGDSVAYAFAGARYNHLAIFEVQAINGVTAVCRASDGAVTTLGMFNERAIKVKEPK